MATMITAARVVLGIYWNDEVKKPRAKSIMIPVMMPQAVVLAPEALLTALLVKEPVTGIEETKEPIMLHIPKASSSCVASKDLPLAKNQNYYVLADKIKISLGIFLNFVSSSNVLSPLKIQVSRQFFISNKG